MGAYSKWSCVRVQLHNRKNAYSMWAGYIKYVYIIYLYVYIYICACIHTITLKIGGTATPTNFEVKILGPRCKHRAIPYWQSVVLWAQSFDSLPFPSPLWA